MHETIKIPAGNGFVIAVPLIQLNRDGSIQEIDANTLTDIKVQYNRTCGESETITPIKEGYHLVLTFSPNLGVAKYDINITGKTAEAHNFCLHLKSVFEIVPWEWQSNWRGYIVEERITLPTQPTIAGWYNDVQPYKDHVNEIIIEFYNILKDAGYDVPLEDDRNIDSLSETAQGLAFYKHQIENVIVPQCYQACEDKGAQIPEIQHINNLVDTIRSIKADGQPKQYCAIHKSHADSATSFVADIGRVSVNSPSSQTQNPNAVKLNTSGYLKLAATENIKAGDVISVTIYNSGSSSGKKVIGFRIGSAEGRVFLAETQGREDYTFERIGLKAEDIAADGSLYMYRYTADGWFVDSKVERETDGNIQDAKSDGESSDAINNENSSSDQIQPYILI